MNSLPERNQIEEKYKWKLEDLYSGDEAFEEDFIKCETLVGEVDFLKDKMTSDAVILKQGLDLLEEIMCLADNLYSYAKMRMDEDNANSKYQVLTARAYQLMVKADTATSFIEPALTVTDESILNDAKLSKYDKYIHNVIRKKAHTLSDKEERLLAMSGDATNAADDIFSMFNNADLTFPEIKDEKGDMVRMTKGRYISFLENKDRRVRKDAFHAMYDTYSNYKNTLAASFTSSIKARKFYADARRYGSSLEAALFEDNIGVEVYENLVRTVNANLPALHRYVEVRADLLGLDKANMYDLYVPLVETDDSKHSYEKACKMVKEGLHALGEEYAGILEKGFSSGWIDVYESKGKTSGAYSWGTYLSHPYVLLNYQGTLDDVFTLAHEMGHSLHSYYSCQAQPYVYSRYKIFVAEVASTVNEILLLKDMIGKISDKNSLAYLLNHFLESFRGTVFRQTMFAEFEKETHMSYQKGIPLSCDDICDLYYNLNRKYFGDRCDVDDKIRFEWSRIPHFYSSFYVYKYATGFSAAAAIADMIEKEGAPAVERYIEFLKTGDRLYPLDALLKVGVDLSRPEPIEKGMKMFSDLLDAFERTMKEKG
ncbi:MAG: oligoendopeptidase F [Clostridia bacterium]